jgi:hypothetical protein
VNATTARRWTLAAATAAATIGAIGFAGIGVVQAAAPSTFNVTTGSLYLTKSGAHYLGDLTIRVTNTTATDVSNANLKVTFPAGLTLTSLNGAWGCVGDFEQYQTCGVDTIAAGETKVITLGFGSFAGSSTVARVTAAGAVTVSQDLSAPGASESSAYRGVLRSSNGSIRNPQPYTPSTAHDSALTSAGTGVVTRDADGTYNVRIPLTIADHTDAFNTGMLVPTAAPAGAGFPSIDPSGVCTSWCEIDGSWASLGETRSFAVLFTMPADTAAGTYSATMTSAMNANTGGEPADATPADNAVTASFVIPVA